ncbi:hypothetical protein [Coleofasciculus sp.]|uniref:hypothetical protein n=1 Tax=Coleofasciculus sp. TaxID=3100458 RepID=UPI0039FA5CBC
MNKRNHRQPQLEDNRDGFFMVAVGDAALAIGKKLTGSQLRLWLYLMMVDPFSDYTASGEPIYHQIPNPADLAIKIGVSRRTVEKDLNLLRDLDLYDYKTTEWWGHNLSAHRARESSKRLKAKQGKGGYLTAETANLTHFGLNNRSVENLTGNAAKKNSDIYKDRVRDQTLQTDQTNQTFSERERETKVEQLKSDPEVNNQEKKQPQTNNFPNPAQQSVNSEEKFSAAAAVVFEIPAEKKRGFYDALRQYAANHGARCPSAYAKTVMADLERTGMCSLWDDFEAGLELGTSDRPTHEWLDPETGKPYPFLVRAVEEIAKAKSNDTVAAATEAAKIIDNAKLCQPIWASVKRELLWYSKEAERMQRLGVRHTYLPPRYSDKPLEPALDEVKDAIASITPGRHVETEHGRSVLEKSEATLPPVAKKREKSQMTPTLGDVETEHGRSVLEKKSNRRSSLTPLAESLNNLNAILGEEETRTLPDPWDFNPLEVHEQRERKTEEALDKARNEAQRQLKASQMEQTLEQIKATLPTDQQKRQAQLQGWMNGEYPYPAIAKRLIEANQNWGLYLEGKRVLEEEF